MKFHLEASPEEIESKAPDLLKALCDSHPAFEEILEKALPHPEHELKYQALRDMKAITDKGYQKMLQAMVRDIGQVLDKTTREVRKSVTLPEGMTAEQAEAILQKAAGEIHEVKETDEDKPEPGDIDVETGELVPEPPTEEEQKEAKEEKELLKATDHTKAIADADEKKYTQVKAVLIQRGFHEADFEPGGPLYGKSVNELLQMLRAA